MRIREFLSALSFSLLISVVLSALPVNASELILDDTENVGDWAAWNF